MRNQQLHRARTARACPRASTACYRITISPGHGPASQQRRSPGGTCLQHRTQESSSRPGVVDQQELRRVVLQIAGRKVRASRCSHRLNFPGLDRHCDGQVGGTERIRRNASPRRTQTVREAGGSRVAVGVLRQRSSRLPHGHRHPVRRGRRRFHDASGQAGSRPQQLKLRARCCGHRADDGNRPHVFTGNHCRE